MYQRGDDQSKYYTDLGSSHSCRHPVRTAKSPRQTVFWRALQISVSATVVRRLLHQMDYSLTVKQPQDLNFTDLEQGTDG